MSYLNLMSIFEIRCKNYRHAEQQPKNEQDQNTKKTELLKNKKNNDTSSQHGSIPERFVWLWRSL